MNPEEAWIGKVLFAGIAGLVIWGITALMQAKSEAAHRTRIVIGGAMALAVAWFVFVTGGPLAVLAVGAVIGASVWIFKGTEK